MESSIYCLIWYNDKVTVIGIIILEILYEIRYLFTFCNHNTSDVRFGSSVQCISKAVVSPQHSDLEM